MPLDTNKHSSGRLNKSVIARSFGRKAKGYDRNATVQPELVRLLTQRVAAMTGLPGSLWLDLGCGTGAVARQFRSCGINAHIVGLDIAREPLLIQRSSTDWPVRLAQGDIDNLPFKAGTFDGITTASSLQWVGNPIAVLRGISALLKKGGILALSVFTAGSFEEIVTTRSRLGLPTALNCIESNAMIQALTETGFSDLAFQEFHRRVFAPDAMTHLRDLSRIGASAVPGRRLSRKQIAEFCDLYESRYRTEEGVPLTFRAIVGICKKLTVNS